jgi:hypothetical protein
MLRAGFAEGMGGRMKGLRQLAVVVALAAVPTASAQAQTIGPAVPASAASRSSPEPAKPAEARGPVIPALTQVTIVIRSHLGSKISKTGETFPLELAEPVLIAGKVMLPAGTPGMGEVIHAKKSGASGSSGELVLAARYLEHGGRRLRLRSMHFAKAGEDAIGTVNTIAVATVATVPAASLIGFFMTGKGIDLPEGTKALAKTAEDFETGLAPPAVAATVPDNSAHSQKGETR